MTQNVSSLTFGARLSQFKTARCLNRKPKTALFYDEWHKAILRACAGMDFSQTEVSADLLLSFAMRLDKFCSSRWNAFVAFAREHTSHGKLLRRRADVVRDFTPPTAAQWENFLALAGAARGSHAGIVARFLAHTGLRISEARALRWENVFEDRIDVLPSVAAKNGRMRSVPHVEGTQETLAALRRVTGATGFVLPRQSARKAIERASLKAFGAKWSWHCFRHLFATRCIESGVDLPTVARWLGHKDGGALLARTYFHLVDDHGREMAEKVRIAAARAERPAASQMALVDLSGGVVSWAMVYSQPQPQSTARA